MKTLLLLAAVVLAGGMLYAAPSVALNGNMFIYTTGYDVNGTSAGTAYLMKDVWTSGASAGLNQTFYTTAESNGEQIAGNIDLYNHDVLLLTAEGSFAARGRMMRVNGSTGASQIIFDFSAANANPGTYPKLVVVSGTGGATQLPDVLISSASRNVRFFSDTSGDGVFQNAERHNLPNAGASTAWAVTNAADWIQDAAYWNGWEYIASCHYNNATTYGLTRINSVDNSAQVAWNGSSWPTPYSSIDTPSQLYFDIVDIDKNGKADLFVRTVYVDGLADHDNELSHWEDINGDGLFTSDEFIAHRPLLTTTSQAQDVELVTDGTHWMALILRWNGDIQYYNVNPDGTFDITTDGSGVLASYGLTPATAPWNALMILRMDQAVPEPATMLLVGTGLLGLTGSLRRRLMK